jgi:hypothetical protein
MKNLTNLLFSALLTINISASDFFFQKPPTASEEKQIYVENADIQYYARQPNEFDPVLEAQGKKITWADPKEYYKYINMINPKSVQEFAIRVPTKGKSNMQIAETFFNFLKNYGIVGFYDPHHDSLDYLKDPSQTLKDGRGDCEDLSATYASFLELRDIDVALAAFYRKTSRGYEEVHIIPLFKVEKNEAKNLRHKLIFPDSSVWVPVETNAIPYLTFKESIAKAINYFEDFDKYLFFLFQEQN